MEEYGSFSIPTYGTPPIACGPMIAKGEVGVPWELTSVEEVARILEAVGVESPRDTQFGRAVLAEAGNRLLGNV